jgi:hypothetical protein
MPLSWNEIRDRATTFAHDWADESYERGEAQTFWNEFFRVFGLQRRRVASFEAHVKKLGDSHGYIDCFWPGTLIAEHKSLGKDLDSAYLQAVDYFAELKERDLPRYVVVSDFATIRLYDLEDDRQVEFPLADLPAQIKQFGFIAGYKPQILRAEDPVNVKAAERMGKLHDALAESGYEGHELEMLLVRLLFCMFAEDTGIFQPAQAFRLWIEERTAEDGSDLGPRLNHLFQVLNRPHEKRSKNLDEQLAAFPYINGDLFDEALSIPSWDSRTRDMLLEACALDWSKISPAVFGAMFQSIMDSEARRNLGAHYTSEQNIEKLIKPLFLDELREEFEQAKRNRNKLQAFHDKLRSLTFLDPACGCGNFLVVTYRALRELELDVLRALHDSAQLSLDVNELIQVDVDQFFGIEIEEFPARIAAVALWLTDHQMNMKVGEEFGMYFARIPLEATPHIHHGNALRIDWEDVVPKERLSYILGNPPFGGKQYQSKEQKVDLKSVVGHLKGSGVLDFVSGWYMKASALMENTEVSCAFVSTNSIAQGEQVGVLWPELLGRGIKINFAHRTFHWSNEARGKAAVHCVIVGFGHQEAKHKFIFEYDDIKAEPDKVRVDNINPYLVDAPEVVMRNRREALSAPMPVNYGSFALDDGNFTISATERDEILEESPEAERFLLPFIWGKELLHNIPRWAIWLKDATPREVRQCSAVYRRVEAVKEWRSNSSRKNTRDLADTPWLFAEIRQPTSQYLVFPTTSSERRRYLPIAMLEPTVIASNQLYIVGNAGPYDFGVLTSCMHNAWMRYVCGRLKSDFRYSAGLVYNNFPWPQNVSDTKRVRIESAAQAVLDAREQFPDSTLADLYDPLTMPPALLKAHRALDKAVDSAYSRKQFAGDADRVAFLFELYQELAESSDD